MFLRSTEDGKAYQAMIDYHANGNLMGINGVKIMEWTETEARHPAKGGMALQVHGGGDYTRQFVRYRNIKVKKLDGAAEDGK